MTIKEFISIKKYGDSYNIPLPSFLRKDEKFPFSDLLPDIKEDKNSNDLVLEIVDEKLTIRRLKEGDGNEKTGN